MRKQIQIDYNNFNEDKPSKKQENKNINFKYDNNIIKPIEIIIKEEPLLSPILDEFKSNNLEKENKNGNTSEIPKSSIGQTNIIEKTEIINKIDEKEDKESDTQKNIIEETKIINQIEDKEDKYENNNNLNKQNIIIEKTEISENKEKEQLYNFSFDKEIINPCIDENINNQEQSIIFKIFQEYQKKNIVSIDLNTLITPKISEQSNDNLPQNYQNKSYEDNNLLSINKDKEISKINLEGKLDEIENVNNIIKGNKIINIFDQKENDIICKKPNNIPLENEKEEKNINNFESMMNYKKSLYEKRFIFDNECSAKINFIENKENLFSNNPIFTSYIKKNIKYFALNNNDDKEKKINLSLKDENDKMNTISANNERRINKIKYLKIFKKPNVDNNRINIKSNFLKPFFFEEIECNYKQLKIKSFLIQNDIKVEKINNINNDKLENIITEIFYSYSDDNITSQKIILEENFFMNNSIDDIHDKYLEKNLVYFDLYNDYCEINDIDVLDDIDIEEINKKYEKFKEKRNKQKYKYICSGNASLELIKDNLSKDQFNNSETDILHNLSLSLKKADNITDNDEIKKLGNVSENFSKSKNLKCLKKLKNELNRSLKNKYIENNRTEIIKKEKEEINKEKDINSISLDKSDNKINNYRSKNENIMKKIKKINDDINKKEKRKYINKLKIQQENNIDQEIKKENIIKYLFPFFCFIIPFFINIYQKYSEI